MLTLPPNSLLELRKAAKPLQLAVSLQLTVYT